MLSKRPIVVSFVIQQTCDENSLRRKKYSHSNSLDNRDSAVIIISTSTSFCTTLVTLLMMTAQSMLSKRPVSKITVALFFIRHCINSYSAILITIVAKFLLAAQELVGIKFSNGSLTKTTTVSNTVNESIKKLTSNYG